MSLDQLRFIPQNAATLQALAQQVLCWARKPNGRSDGRVRTGTAWNTHIVVPAAVCAEYGAPTFTAMDGAQTIACPAEGDGQVTYYIFESDVPPLNIADCSPLTLLPTPAGLAAGTITDDSIAVSWTAAAGATGYNVRYRVAPAGAWTVVTATGTSTTITGLTVGTAYHVQVQATDSTGEFGPSLWSASINATTLAAQLSTPTALAAGTPTTTTVPLTWGAVTGANGYHVQYKLSADSTWTDFTPDPSAAAATVTGLTASSAYDFRVKAKGNGTTSSDSDYTALVSASTTA
jgi:hypothetical protein